MTQKDLAKLLNEQVVPHHVSAHHVSGSNTPVLARCTSSRASRAGGWCRPTLSSRRWSGSSAPSSPAFARRAPPQTPPPTPPESPPARPGWTVGSPPAPRYQRPADPTRRLVTEPSYFRLSPWEGPAGSPRPAAPAARIPRDLAGPHGRPCPGNAPRRRHLPPPPPPLRRPLSPGTSAPNTAPHRPPQQQPGAAAAAARLAPRM